MKEHCFHIMFVLHAYHLDHCFKVINCPSLMSHYAAVLLVTGLTCFLCRINLLYNLPVHLKLWKIDMLSLCEKKVFDWAIFFISYLFITSGIASLDLQLACKCCCGCGNTVLLTRWLISALMGTGTVRSPV